MRSVPPSAPGPARLSNYLTALAADVAGDVAAYRRGSIEAHRAYLSGAAKLVEARGACRRGEWGPFLERAGVGSRAAQDMMALARAGVTAERMTELGGVRAALEAIRYAAAVAVEAAASADDDGEKHATVAGISGACGGDEAAEKAPGRAVEVDTGGEPAGVQGEPVSGVLGGSEGRTGARAARVAAGLCRCGREAVSGRRQCERCLTRDRTRTRSRLAGGRYAAALDRRLREAAATGRGLALSPADVAKLVGDGGGRKR